MIICSEIERERCDGEREGGKKKRRNVEIAMGCICADGRNKANWVCLSIKRGCVIVQECEIGILTQEDEERIEIDR